MDLLHGSNVVLRIVLDEGSGPGGGGGGVIFIAVPLIHHTPPNFPHHTGIGPDEWNLEPANSILVVVLVGIIVLGIVVLVGVVLGIVVLVGNGWALPFYPVGNCPQWDPCC